MRYVVYYSAKRKAGDIETFFSKLSEVENLLNGMMNEKFNSRKDMIKTVTAYVKGMERYISLKFTESSFTYSLKHKTIEMQITGMGYFILLTNTMKSEGDILSIYRNKDVVEKAFMRSKSVMEPLYAHTEEGTRAKVFLSILSYAIIAMIASKCGLTYNQTMDTMKGIKEVIYT
ncbi:MAG: hypothetical protein ACP5RS_07385, partial [Thermoplasmata archaeon]